MKGIPLYQSKLIGVSLKIDTGINLGQSYAKTLLFYNDMSRTADAKPGSDDIACCPIFMNFTRSMMVFKALKSTVSFAMFNFATPYWNMAEADWSRIGDAVIGSCHILDVECNRTDFGKFGFHVAPPSGQVPYRCHPSSQRSNFWNVFIKAFSASQPAPKILEAPFRQTIAEGKVEMLSRLMRALHSVNVFLYPSAFVVMSFFAGLDFDTPRAPPAPLTTIFTTLPLNKFFLTCSLPRPKTWPSRTTVRMKSVPLMSFCVLDFSGKLW